MNKKNDISFLIAKILRKLKLKKLSVFFNDKRHSIIEEELNEICNEIIKMIHNCSDVIGEDSNDKVWVFWWQGVEQMPELVRCCYYSLKTQLKDKKVILITKNNIKEYCTFPEYIFQKYESGQITLTHLSDILRFDLLSHYGGLYTDATVFWTGNISAIKYSNLYTCGGYSDEYYFNVSKGRWTGFLIGGCRENPLFRFMYNFFLEYWKQSDELIDYFLIDYALNYAYQNNIGSFKDYVDNVAPSNNPNLFKLMDVRNKRCSRKGREELMATTYAFKLSYKKKFDTKENTYARQIVFKNNNGEIQ